MMHERLRPTLALLDQGLSLYRKHFTSFALIAAVWFVPVVILFGLGWAVAVRQGVGAMIGLGILGALLAALLLLYLMGALSRAANMVLDEQPIRLRAVFGIPPQHLLGMSLFSILYTILSQIALSALSMFIMCPMYFVILLLGASSSLGNATGSIIFGVASGVIFLLIYMASTFLSCAMISGLIYGLQPWAYGYAGFGQAIQRSIDMITYRLVKNVGIWGCAAIVMLGAGTAVSTLLTIISSVPMSLLTHNVTTLTNAVIAATWMMSTLLVLPPLPIWMALLYRSNLALREGAAFQAQVDTWWRQIQETAQPLEG